MFDLFEYSSGMNQAALKTFLAIVDTGNLNRAAERLHVTQSTVSARLNTLEQELGQSLFHRRKSGAELTAAGFRFERYAQLMTQLWRQALQETSLPSNVETILNLGCCADLWPVLGQQVFMRARQTHPETALSAWQAEQDDLTRWLANGLIDVAISHAPMAQENWVSQPLIPQRLVLVSTCKRGLMRWDPDYVYVDFGDDFRRNHAAAYADGDSPMTVFGSPLWALDYLLAFGGSAYLPERLIMKHLAGQQLHIVADAPVFFRSSYLVSNTSVDGNRDWLWQLVTETDKSIDN